MRALRLPAFVALAAVLVPVLSAQTVPERGGPATFDVAAWNIEHFGDPGFPPSDATQIANVEAVIAQAGIDLWAVQEIGSQDAWSELLLALQDDGYSGRLGEETFGFQIRLAFVFDPSVVQVIGTRHILSGGNFGGRRPFEMQARVTVEGETRTVRVISLHAKAGTGSDDYADRQAGAVELKAYIDDQVSRGEEVILLGDFNDLLVGSTRGGGLASPYDVFVQDAGYVAATLPLQQAGLNTFCRSSTCASGDTRDHLLFTAGLSDAYVDGSADRFGEVLDIDNYVNSTSDHVPVLARFSFLATDAAGDPDAGVALLPSAPNPFRAGTRLRFRLDAPGDVRLDVFDALGRRVASLAGAFGGGEHAVPLRGEGLAPGVYVVRLQAAGGVQTQRLVRAE
ncbi:endonuclease/exonuclease/phosphatase family protein [Rubrivirga sp.]|uniref:endonuclease/exonuclease/phosphatase family protein n=1 Tax=Rubrivirga sp. TaxID=1885344 RepID=UPI003B523B45